MITLKVETYNEQQGLWTSIQKCRISSGEVVEERLLDELRAVIRSGFPQIFHDGLAGVVPIWLVQNGCLRAPKARGQAQADLVGVPILGGLDLRDLAWLSLQ